MEVWRSFFSQEGNKLPGPWCGKFGRTSSLSQQWTTISLLFTLNHLGFNQELPQLRTTASPQMRAFLLFESLRVCCKKRNQRGDAHFKLSLQNEGDTTWVFVDPQTWYCPGRSKGYLSIPGSKRIGTPIEIDRFLMRKPNQNGKRVEATEHSGLGIAFASKSGAATSRNTGRKWGANRK